MTDKTHAPRLTWTKQKRERGLAGMVQGPLGYDLNYGEHRAIAQVRAVRTGFHVYKGWYFYTYSNMFGIPRVNTSHAPKVTLEEAKADAETIVRDALGLPKRSIRHTQNEAS